MRGSPGLHDHAPGNDHQVFSLQHAAERRELAAGFPADLCGAARGRRMLLRIHVEFKKLLGRNAELHGLLNRFGYLTTPQGGVWGWPAKGGEALRLLRVKV